jgi:hypothetical protein
VFVVDPALPAATSLLGGADGSAPHAAATEHEQSSQRRREVATGRGFMSATCAPKMARRKATS